MQANVQGLPTTEALHRDIVGLYYRIDSWECIRKEELAEGEPDYNKRRALNPHHPALVLKILGLVQTR